MTTERAIWVETKETILANKASLIFPKTRADLKELIRYVRKVIVENNLCDQRAA